MSSAVLEHPALQKISRVPPATVNRWTVWIVGILTIYALSQLTWQVLEVILGNHKVEAPKVSVASSPGSKSVRLNMAPVVGSHLFGKVERKAVKPKPVVKQETVKETSLSAKLRGVFASTDPKLSNATIELDRNEQNVYFIGDRFKDATLKEVKLDHVIIERRGKREMLSLENFAPTTKGSGSKVASSSSLPGSSSKANRKKRVLDKRRDRRATSALIDLRNKVKENPTSVMDLITGQPHMKDGQFAGFKIRPGKDRRLFSRLGLRSNDVVTTINGTVLDNPQTAMQMMGQMDSIDELSLTVLRGNQEVDLQFSLKQ